MIQSIVLNFITNLINIFLDFLYPENISCILCNNSISKNTTYSMCKDCFSNINFILDGCIKCGKPIINYSLEQQSIDGCSYCLNKGFYFDKVISCLEYTEISKKLVFGLKYNNKTYLSKYISIIMKEKLDLENIKFDYILFVPLHKNRLRERGFNQAEKIANNLSSLIDIPVIDIIGRRHNTEKLYKLGKDDRIKELKNAFIIKDNMIDLKNKNILLIDDIFTTGSTVNEISKVLKISGVNKVFVATLLTRADTFYITI
ncbi:MAG TPA: ComF family protein [Romboutsia timonensis]|uniref:ComF family protein n=1 Tax=Romboutsia timonensis TaxID=1776391 RepID=A0A921N142_9FIRM|nr:ComF family protein [Romboutsia timonensis]